MQETEYESIYDDNGDTTWEDDFYDEIERQEEDGYGLEDLDYIDDEDDEDDIFDDYYDDDEIEEDLVEEDEDETDWDDDDDYWDPDDDGE
jgi:hypothetical protein